MISDHRDVSAANALAFRLANAGDASELARIHLASASGPFNELDRDLGKKYMVCYYRILLSTKGSFVVCAETPDRGILGFTSGTLDYHSHHAALHRYRYRLLLAALPRLALHPGTIARLWRRYSSLRTNGDAVITAAAHFLFWCWLPGAGFGGGAIFLFKKGISVVRLLGADAVEGEVDRQLHKIIELHKKMGAKVVKEFVSAEGVPRVAIIYDSLQSDGND